MFWKKSYTFDKWSLASLKLAMIFFTFIVLKIWSSLGIWVYNTNTWWFVLIFVLLCIKPLQGCCGKRVVKAEKAERKVKRKRK